MRRRGVVPSGAPGPCRCGDDAEVRRVDHLAVAVDALPAAAAHGDRPAPSTSYRPVWTSAVRSSIPTMVRCGCVRTRRSASRRAPGVSWWGATARSGARPNPATTRNGGRTCWRCPAAIIAPDDDPDSGTPARHRATRWAQTLEPARRACSRSGTPPVSTSRSARAIASWVAWRSASVAAATVTSTPRWRHHPTARPTVRARVRKLEANGTIPTTGRATPVSSSSRRSMGSQPGVCSWPPSRASGLTDTG